VALTVAEGLLYPGPLAGPFPLYATCEAEPTRKCCTADWTDMIWLPLEWGPMLVVFIRLVKGPMPAECRGEGEGMGAHMQGVDR
jgi:hypothetical protein